MLSVAMDYILLLYVFYAGHHLKAMVLPIFFIQMWFMWEYKYRFFHTIKYLNNKKAVKGFKNIFPVYIDYEQQKNSHI